jgi:phage shock protein PspC (stress-responsive transcriptional regulator)
MQLSDEIERLAALHRGGALSDAEFARAKAQLLDADARPSHSALDALNRLRRRADDRWIAGVCSGLARASGAEAWVWRLLFTLAFFFGGAGLVIYLLMWLFVPMSDGTKVTAPGPN